MQARHTSNQSKSNFPANKTGNVCCIPEALMFVLLGVLIVVATLSS